MASPRGDICPLDVDQGNCSRPLSAEARAQSGADSTSATIAASIAEAVSALIDQVTISIAAAAKRLEVLAQTIAALASTAAGYSIAAGKLRAAKVPAGHYDLLRGTLNPDSPLALLRGNEHVWTDIFGRVDDWYEQHIDRTPKAFRIIQAVNNPFYRKPVFPKPSGININMMPIRYSWNSHLPAVCTPYIEVLHACFACIPGRELDNVMYLTIHEELVPVGQVHRRPGLHIESPKALSVTGELVHGSDPRFQSLNWGKGCFGSWEGIPSGGIFMASNVANSTRIWPVLIKDPVDVTDEHGGIEHMRERLGPGQVLAANELCWFTDRTPHESLPLQAPEGDRRATHVYRQFFRLVVGQISVWYSKHNTPNPDGLLPDAPISDRDKYEATPPADVAD